MGFCQNGLSIWFFRASFMHEDGEYFYLNLEFFPCFYDVSLVKPQTVHGLRIHSLYHQLIITLIAVGVSASVWICVLELIIST